MNRLDCHLDGKVTCIKQYAVDECAHARKRAWKYTLVGELYILSWDLEFLLR